MIKKLIRFIQNPKPYILLIADNLSKLGRDIVSLVAPYSFLDDKLFIKHRFEELLGYKLNLKCPKTFNEKIQWLKLYYRNPLYTKLADKYAVREYVKEKIGPNYLVKLLAVYDRPQQIDWQSLPDKFVIKTTHSSTLNILCEDKNVLDTQSAINKLENWMNFNHYRETNSREWHVKNIEPKIVIEEFLNGDPEFGLLDYKFYCYWGAIIYIEVHIDRFTSHSCNIYDLSWNQLPFLHGFPHSKKEIDKPNNFEEMLSIAHKLSQRIPFCRVDLYNFNDKIYFGEMTFTPGGGFDRFDSYVTDLLFGQPLSLPENIDEIIF